MKVELQKGRWRGDRAIVVDGRRWGEIHMRGVGSHGSYYEFYQIRAPRSDKITRIGDKNEERVWSQRNSVSFADQDKKLLPASLPVRLVEASKRLIAEGKLRDPVEVACEAKAAFEATRENTRKKKEREDHKWRRRAKRVLDEAQRDDISVADMCDRILDEIVALMRWAQTQ